MHPLHEIVILDQVLLAGDRLVVAQQVEALHVAVEQVPLAVEIGVFRDEPQARELAERARREGFSPVRVPALEDAGGPLFAVRVGVYATAGDARSAGERLGRALGVAWRVVPAP